MSPTAKRRHTHVSENKDPPCGPQLLPLSRKDQEFWQQQGKRLRESLPAQYIPEQREELRKLGRVPQLPVDPAVDAIAAQARAEARQELEPEQVPARQAIEQPTEQPIVQISEQAETPAPPEAAPIKRIDTKEWWARWTKANPRRKGETKRDYATRGYKEMEKAPVTRMWTEEGCRRALYPRPQDAGLADPASVQSFPKRR
jgi:hypothetical protein